MRPKCELEASSASIITGRRRAALAVADDPRQNFFQEREDVYDESGNERGCEPFAGKVFAFIANFENNPSWQSGMQEARKTSDDPIGVGTTYNQLAKFLGRPVESSFEIIEFEPNERIKGRSTSGSFPITFTRTVESDPEGTKVSALIEGDASGFFRLAAPILDRMVQRQVNNDYQKLKSLLESGD